MKIFGVIFEKMKILNFFLIWTTLHFEGRSKSKKKWVLDICKGILDIEFKRDWSVGLDDTLGDGQKIKNYFSSLRDFFFRKTTIVSYCWGSSVLINSQNLIKIIFEKIEILNFF